MTDSLRFENFQFIDFEPENDLKTYSKELFWLVEEKAPSQAAKSATLKKLEDKYVAHFKIISSSGVFESEHSSTDPRQSVSGAYDKIKDVLKDWSIQK